MLAGLAGSSSHVSHLSLSVSLSLTCYFGLQVVATVGVMMVVWRWVVAAAAVAVAATPLRRRDPAVAAGVAGWWRAVVAAWTFVFF
jgi:membrane associated rhomboid family serine protease